MAPKIENIFFYGGRGLIFSVNRSAMKAKAIFHMKHDCSCVIVDIHYNKCFCGGVPQAVGEWLAPGHRPRRLAPQLGG